MLRQSHSATAIEIETGRKAIPTIGGSECRAGSFLTIDLEALAANYRSLRGLIGASECAAVVKANAYGLGAVHVSRALWAAGCRSFFVAHLDEAIELRNAIGPEAAVYVLNGLPYGAEQDCIAAGAIPVLNSIEQATCWREAAQARKRRLPAAIQADTGMSRLGLSQKHLCELASDDRFFASVDNRLLLSHLACADRQDHGKNRAQLTAFALARCLVPGGRASLANSSGIFIDPDFHFDLVRPGAALYGINPVPGCPNPMKPVVRVSAKVIQTHSLRAGDTVGYGNSFQADAPMRIATISFGYADGWPRCATGNAAAYFEGMRLPFVGRVSMDSITIDVSNANPDILKPGSLVDLINDLQTVDHVAAFAGTIGYEILTGLGRRSHKTYLGD